MTAKNPPIGSYEETARFHTRRGLELTPMQRLEWLAEMQRSIVPFAGAARQELRKRRARARDQTDAQARKD